MQSSLSKRTLSDGDLNPLGDLLETLQLSTGISNATIIGADPLLRSPHHLAEATAFALLLEASAASAVWQDRGGKPSSLDIELIDAIHALHSTHFLWQSGYAMSVGAEFVPTNGIFKCKDDRYIMTESGPPYTKLERGYLNFFDCGNNRESLAREIAKHDAEDLQEKLSALGLPACVAYTHAEWLKHPQGQVLANTPLIEIEKIAEGKPRGLAAQAAFPLDGIRVVDFTHVLAGPRSMRSLAQYGADVMHISSPYHRDTVSQNLLVNMGKRSAYLLLTEPESLKTMNELIAAADVFACSYRPSVANRFKLDCASLTQKHEGLVYLSVNAFGHAGPWAQRAGFDHNVQVATGFAATEGGDDKPRLSPVFYLNDLLTGYLASAGVMTALRRRAIEGGSYHVKVSLARTAMWVQSLGLFPRSVYGEMPEKDEYPCKFHLFDSAYGEIKELAPAVHFSNMPSKTLTSIRPFGADSPCWR